MIKRFIQVLLLSWFQVVIAQSDFSTKWEDHFSYNNVKEFVKVDSKIYALVDNALFEYDLVSQETTKISSVNGLSGEETSTIYYSKEFDRIVVGYESGLLEIISSNGTITIAKDIVNFNYSGSKRINNITQLGNKLYLSTSFAIIVYDIENLEFGDTYFIGDQSTEEVINEIEIYDGVIYAGTENGVYVADSSNPNLIDYNNWTQNFSGNFTSIEVFNNQVYASRGKNLYLISTGVLDLKKTFPENIKKLKSSEENLSVSGTRNVVITDSFLNEIINYTSTSSSQYYFNLNMSYFEEEKLFLGTQEFGVLMSSVELVDDFTEIHPEGPISNLPFSIAAKENHLWVVYGLYNSAYGPLNGKFPFSHYNGEKWVNKPYSDFNVKNLVHITFHPDNINKVYLSSWGASNPNDISNTGGMLLVEEDEVVDFWNFTNSGLEKVFLPQYPNYLTTRINGSAFDRDGNLWIANAWVDERVKKFSNSGNWSGFDMSSVITNTALGLNELVIDRANNIFIGSRRNGVLAFNENGNKKRSLTTEATQGSLPDLNARTVQVDARNRLWIGTLKGLVMLNNSTRVFDEELIDAEPVIILENDVPKRLLGEQTINSIAVDGADNKWFGTDLGGVLQTNPSGLETLQNFNKDNSPLPSNRIVKVAVDESTGKVFFATDKGIVAYNSNVATYGENLPEIYAYPNPSNKSNEFITIDGRNGQHLPKGTNIKILDAAGNLVYETNVTEGQELFGGKVIWNKTNLAGKKVASGVYIVLLTANENTESQVAKIAIIN